MAIRKLLSVFILSNPTSNMLNIILAIFISLLLSTILGGLLTFFIKFLLAIFFIPFIAYFKGKNNKNIVVSTGPWILTIEFLSGIFFGYLTVYLGKWTFESFELKMDWLFPAFFTIFFIWFDLNRIRSDNFKFNFMLNKDLKSGMADEQINLDAEKQRSELLNHQTNMRYTALFGKLSGLLMNSVYLFH